MKRTLPFMLVMLTLPVFLVSAQNAAHGKKQPQGRPEQLDVQQAAEQKTDLNDKPVIGKPTAELNVDEFQLKRFELAGQVIELTFDRILGLKEVEPGSYVAFVTYHDSDAIEGLRILVPKAGLDLFKGRVSSESDGSQTVYVQVQTPDLVKAVGTYYTEEDEGVHYGW